VALLWPYAESSAVVADDYLASRRATQHLLDLGHRRIGFLGYQHSVPVAERVAGYHSAFSSAGIVPDPRWLRNIEPGPPGDIIGVGEVSMESWLRDNWRQLGCTALLAQNDYVAVGALRALQAAGLRVPHDVSVIGWDDIDIARACMPALTTIAVPLEQIGERSFDLLAAHVVQTPGERTNVVLPGRVVIRASIAPPPA
jgi:LacI family transcriptional regulator